VAALKLPVLGALYECFRERHLLRDTHRARALRQFQRGRGATLRAHAVFAAIQARLQAEDPALWGWPAWPEPWRDPEGETVRRFVQEHPEAVE
ncbi:4-alpha-glucanotransferase, partial [Escherichia coli]|nr:4-alpha-glucanotransferase [Escherichia coli]